MIPCWCHWHIVRPPCTRWDCPACSCFLPHNTCYHCHHNHCCCYMCWSVDGQSAGRSIDALEWGMMRTLFCVEDVRGTNQCGPPAPWATAIMIRIFEYKQDLLCYLWMNQHSGVLVNVIIYRFCWNISRHIFNTKDISLYSLYEWQYLGCTITNNSNWLVLQYIWVHRSPLQCIDKPNFRKATTTRNWGSVVTKKSLIVHRSI